MVDAELTVAMLNSLSDREIRQVLKKMRYKDKVELINSEYFNLCNEGCLEALAKDRSKEVVANFLEKVDLSKLRKSFVQEIIDKYKNDSYVMYYFSQREDLPNFCSPECITDIAKYDAGFVISQRKDLGDICPSWCIDELAHSEQSWIRENIARRPDLPKICSEECIEDLAHDKDEGVREEIAKRPDLAEICSPECIEDLAHDENEYVRWLIANRKDLPEICSEECIEEIKRKIKIR